MNLSYKDLVFELNKTENYMMDLCMLPTDINLRCADIKISVAKPYMSSCVYFDLSRNFDIFFSIKLITNSEHIIKTELCYVNGLEPIKDIEFNTDINLPLYIHQYTSFCIKVSYDSIANIPQEVILMFDAGLLQNKYRNDRTISFV